MLDFEDARKKVLGCARTKEAEFVPLAKALGRVLAEDLKARTPIPPFRKATMDGYAVRSQDLSVVKEDYPITLELIDSLPAGKISRSKVKAGKAVSIMTGAALPEGADTVVKVEDTERKGSKVIVRVKVPAGENIGEIGEDVAKGELVLQRGTVIGPAEVGMLASLGMKTVKVSIKPSVAVIATGSELVEPGAKLTGGKIYNSNAYALCALASKAGAEPKYLGIAPDRKLELRRKLSQARKYDLLVLSGGVSVGDYDLVKEQLKEFGVKPIFWQVKIKPGKPMFFGTRRQQQVFGLPGNPVSAMLTFQLFVRPAIDKMLGKNKIGLPAGRAILLDNLTLKPGRRQFIRGILDRDGMVMQVMPFPFQKSGILKSMVKSNVLIVVPPEIEAMEKGEEVEILFLD